MYMSSGILALPKYRSGHPAGHPKLLQLETPLHTARRYHIVTMFDYRQNLRDTRPISIDPFLLAFFISPVDIFSHVISCFGHHLGLDRTGNSAIRSADPENPTLERNMKWIG